MNARFPGTKDRSGFTLIEVIITLSIFLLLSAAVFGIFSATLESVSGLQDNQNQSDEVEALSAFLRKNLLELPADGSLTSYHREGAPFKVSGLIWGAGNDLRAADMQLQPNGYYSLRLAYYTPPANPQAPAPADFQRQIVSDDPSLAWRVLVRDIRTADWRFRGVNATQWDEQASNNKPVVAEFSLQLAGSTTSVTDDFWIPQTLPITLQAATPPPATGGGI
jgi:prepilin-type N-terminal cleavage/methylation domain-containing protein